MAESFTGQAVGDLPPSTGPMVFLFVRVPRFIMGALMLTAIGINIANVIGRYLFNFSLYWGEEITIYLNIWCVGLGIVAATYKGAHLRMDLISARIRSPWREIINGGTAVAFVAASAFVAVQSFKVVSLLYLSGQVSVAAALPMFIPHTSMLVGFTLMAVAVIVRFRAYLLGKF